MDGLPVTVRLLDPPLHEFLPSVEELRDQGGHEAGLDAEEQAMLDGRRELGRAQPDDRHPRRAPRRRQARASTRCRCGRCSRPPPTLRKQGKNPIVEIMIPLTVTREELALARCWVEDEIDAEFARASRSSPTSRSAR